jgi:hypothetical protein
LVKLIVTLYRPAADTLASGRPNLFSAVLCSAWSNVKTTSALVNGLPSVHFTLCRSCTVRVLPPADQA